jgi:carnitine O-octanoyltransferase
VLFETIFSTEDEGPPLTNLLIFCQGRIFYFDVTDSKGEPITIPEIQHQLIQIQQSCDGKPWGPGLGALTGGNRTDFYRVIELPYELPYNLNLYLYLTLNA